MNDDDKRGRDNTYLYGFENGGFEKPSMHAFMGKGTPIVLANKISLLLFPLTIFGQNLLNDLLISKKKKLFICFDLINKIIYKLLEHD